MKPGARSFAVAAVQATALYAWGCVPGGAAPGAASPGGFESGTLPLAVHWVRSSAEHRAVFVQVYRDAAEHVREVEVGLPDGRWGVILDADETVLDNSTYQRRLADRGESFSNDTWNAWVREEAATAQPGAPGFIELVRSLGGRVAIVTNRDEEVCDATRRNLAALSIAVDVVLCQQPGERGKGGRFRAVQEGTAAAGIPPLEVVAWLGDNIQDFPGLSQDVRDAPESALDLFGLRYFLLPNPMYGSWERNPVR